MLNPIHLTGPADDQEVERLRVEVASLRKENRMLRRKLPKSTGDMRRLRQAHRDAKAMILHRFAGYSISRESCVSLAISERRWVNARALLQVAQVYGRSDIVVEDFDVAIARLDHAFASMEQAGSAERLRARLPPSRGWSR